MNLNLDLEVKGCILSLMVEYVDAHVKPTQECSTAEIQNAKLSLYEILALSDSVKVLKYKGPTLH